MYNGPSLEVPVSKTLRDWLAEGEQLYSAAMQEYQSIEAQLDELEVKLAAKKSELNQIAQVIGKPPVEGNRRHVTASHSSGHSIVPAGGGIDIIDAPSERTPTAGSNASIARALTGKFGR
jgi:hypothetical protein